MPIEVQGLGGAIVEADPTFDALRVTQRPPEAAGAFRLAAFTGLTTGLAANGSIFLFRNPDAVKLIILQYLMVRAVVVTGFTAAQELAFDVLPYRGWTVAAGGNAIATTNHNLKKRSGLAASIADIRIAAAAVVTTPAAPAVADANAFLVGHGKTLAAAATVQDAAFESQFDATNGSDYPIVLGQNDGFAVRNSILMAAAGTVRWGITAAWLEAPAY